MALIKINIADSLLSESAAKKPGYKMAKVGGASALVISSEHKPAVSKCISNARKAQKLALSALKNRIEANTIAAVRVPREENPTRKAKLRQRVKAMKTKASADVKTAKQLLREGTAAMKAAGLSALSSPLKASDISLTSEPGRSARTVKAAQTDSLVIKGKKGYSKPKFLAASKFEALGSKAPTKAATKAPIKKMKGAITGAHTPAKARAVKKQRAEAITGKKPEGISGAAPGKRIDDYTDPKVKSAITRFVKKADSDLSRLTNEELKFAQSSLLNKRQSRANMGHGKKAGTLYNGDTYQRVMDEIKRRKG